MKIMNEINYFNEALIVAAKAYKNIDNNYDYDLIDYSKISISKNKFDKKYKDLLKYFKTVQMDSISIVSDYDELRDLFINGEKLSGIFDLIKYGKYKNSIKEYTKDELTKMIKDILIGDIKYNTNEKIDEDKIDYLILVEKAYRLDSVQKYILLKFFKNISGTLDKFYEMILKLENMLKEKFYLIENNYIELRKKVEAIDIIEEFKDIKFIYEQPVFKNVSEKEVYLFINLDTLNTLSAYGDENSLTALINIGLLPFLLNDYNLNLGDKKDNIQKKLSCLCDSTRFEILYLLSKEKYFGKEISEKLNISKATVSYHLNHLSLEELVQIEIDGKKILYSLNRRGFDEIISFLNCMLGKKDE